MKRQFNKAQTGMPIRTKFTPESARIVKLATFDIEEELLKIHKNEEYATIEKEINREEATVSFLYHLYKGKILQSEFLSPTVENGSLRNEASHTYRNDPTFKAICELSFHLHRDMLKYHE